MLPTELSKTLLYNYKENGSPPMGVRRAGERGCTPVSLDLFLSIFINLAKNSFPFHRRMSLRVFVVVCSPPRPKKAPREKEMTYIALHPPAFDETSVYSVGVHVHVA